MTGADALAPDDTAPIALATATVTLLTVHTIALVAFPGGTTPTVGIGLAVFSGLVSAVILTLGGDQRAWALAAGGAAMAGPLGFWLLWRVADATLWQVAIGVGAGLGLTSYVIHRYERLRLGLLEETS